VKTSEFVVPLSDLERGPKHVVWQVSSAWLEVALADTEASTSASGGELDVELMKNGREVMVRGSVRVEVTMPCSRTLEPVPVPVNSEIFLLLGPAPLAAASTPRPRRADRQGHGKQPRAGQKAPDKKSGSGWAGDPALSNDDAARDTYSGDQIVLDPFVREFILLELPMSVTQIGLPSEEVTTIAPSSAAAVDNAPDSAERPVDPRLLPLVEIASRLRKKE
jgi:uncharacterized protein